MPIFLKRIFGSAAALKRNDIAALSIKMGLYVAMVMMCISFNQDNVSVKEVKEEEITIKSDEQKAMVLSLTSAPQKINEESLREEEKLLWSMKQQAVSIDGTPSINREGSFEYRALASRSSSPIDMRRKEPVAVASNKSQNFEAISVVATGYTAGRESTGKTPDHPSYGITFSGIKVHRDAEAVSTVAADPKVFPIGTLLYIPDYGYGIVADTGSAIKGNKIDLYYHSVDDVYNEWGKKTIDVYVIEEGDGRLSEEKFNAWKQQVKDGTVMKPILE